jgi:Kef-type K+ transport system membrane component KefB
VHPPPIDARPTAAASSSPPPPPPVAAAPAVALGDGNNGGSPALGAGFILLLAAACLALAFAAIPGRVLGTVSTRLIERRDDIGLAVVLGMTLIAVMFLVLLVT